MYPNKEQFLAHVLPRVCARDEETRLARIPFLDLDLLFYMELQEEGDVLSFYTLTKEQLQEWELDMSQLRTRAKENAGALLSCRLLQDVLDEEGLSREDAPLYVMGLGQNKPYGAGAALLHTECLHDLADRLEQEQLFLIPSSIHEILILPVTETDANELNEIITHINRTVVAPRERLSDHVYRFEAHSGAITW